MECRSRILFAYQWKGCEREGSGRESPRTQGAEDWADQRANSFHRVRIQLCWDIVCTKSALSVLLVVFPHNSFHAGELWCVADVHDTVVCHGRVVLERFSQYRVLQWFASGVPLVHDGHGT